MAVTGRIQDGGRGEAAARDARAGTDVQDRPRLRPGRISRLTAARVAVDALSLGGAVALAFVLRFRWHVLETTPAPLDLPAHLVAASMWVVAVVGTMASHRLYDEDTLGPQGGEATRIRRSLLEGVAVVSTAVFLLRLLSVSRGWFVLVVVLSLALLLAERRTVPVVLRKLRARGRFRRPAILVTTGGSTVEEGTGEFEIVAAVRPAELGGFLRSGQGQTLLARTSSPVVIVEASQEGDGDELWHVVLEAGDAGLPVFVQSAFRALPADRLSTRTLGRRTIVKVSPPALTGVRAVQKRLLDVVAAGALLVVTAVPMGAVALAILLGSGRPILYGQQRVGRDGRLFTMWKLRTMRVDAEAETGPVWASRGDSRRTPLGRILRRLSLDELPQLWNVLRGHMSLVGPRPERPTFVASFSEGDPWYRFRHRIRPGITGLAQVRGLRGDTPLEPRVESDNWYIEHWSVALDLRIAAGTIMEVVRGRNAS